jgi:hypothetical protein
VTIAATDIARLHAQAIADRLTTALATEGYPVYVGEVTTPEDAITYPYLVIWPAPAARPVVTMAGHAGQASTTIQVTAAAAFVADVLAALDRAGNALHRWTPTIAGRLCAPVTQDPNQVPPPIPDPRVKTTAGRPVYISSIVVTLYSTAGGAP